MSAVTQLNDILSAVMNSVGDKTDYSAEDFGKYANGAMGTEDQQGIILVRLFPQDTIFEASSLNTAGEYTV